MRLDAAITSDTRLTFCTTGILLRRLAGDADLLGVSHVVVDEVHERTLQVLPLSLFVYRQEKLPCPNISGVQLSSVPNTLFWCFTHGLQSRAVAEPPSSPPPSSFVNLPGVPARIALLS